MNKDIIVAFELSVYQRFINSTRHTSGKTTGIGNSMKIYAEKFRGKDIRHITSKFITLFMVLVFFGCAHIDPLIDASLKGNTKTVETLIAQGTDVNIRSPKGATALIMASLAGHKEIVKLLLDRGADVNAKNVRGESALYVAARRGHKEIVQLLLARGADVNAKDDTGLTPFAMASLSGHEDIAKLLLAHGAND